MKKWVIVAGVFFFLSGCDMNNVERTINQSKMCVASTDEQAIQCPEGELFMARLANPRNGSSAYNTLNTAALYCDTNYRIFENSAGVVCVMTHKRLKSLAGVTSQDESSQSSASKHRQSVESK
ncbi:hypothetical protein [Chromohalobacter israelensis]|uniref:hypothetical protein n=1 Tax=Chromohalobacter israelensis TaxID=141390 RepID=UPI00265BF44F|nr:hypothetical protein [Chromohalobacter salexigens]MDO0944949.1 hypothetical protein [Chromohalobacter salexigens]